MFSMFTNNIQIFSNEGLLKLTLLKKQLHHILTIQYENKQDSSPYSRNMIKTIIEILDLVCTNNNVNHWSKSKNILSLETLSNLLDGGKGTLVPEVFNTESYHLAEIIFEALKTFDFETDLNKLARVAINQIANPTVLSGIMTNNIKSKIQLYEMLKNNKTETASMHAISIDMFKYFNELESNTNNIDIQTYQTNCLDFINKINSVPYLRLCNADDFVNLLEPYKFKIEDLVTAGGRFRLIKELLISESELNKSLIKASKPILTVAYDNYLQCFSLTQYLATKEKLIMLCNNLIHTLESYIKGEHLNSSFSRVDKDKSDCAANLIVILKKYNKILLNENQSPVIGMQSFNLFKDILISSYQNENIATAKRMSLGHLSKILNNAALDFFAFTFNDINQSNDVALSHELAKYENACEIKLEVTHNLQFKNK